MLNNSEANTEYAHLRLQDGKEITVSLRHLVLPREYFTIDGEDHMNNKYWTVKSFLIISLEG